MNISDQFIDDLINKIRQRKIMKKVTSNHKEYYAFLSKLGKTIDKNFKYSEEICNIFNKELDKDLVNKLIFQHMI